MANGIRQRSATGRWRLSVGQLAATGRRRLSVALLVAALSLALGGIALATSGGAEPVKYVAPGGKEYGLRPTGVGLPSVGESATVGAGELIATLISYHESG